MMTAFDRLLERLVRPADLAAVADSTGGVRRLRLLARVAWRFFWVYLVLVLMALLWTGAAGMDVYHRTEMPEFCGTCHEMGANFKTWSSSRHESIRCVDCHARSGVTGWLAAKMAGVSQLVTHVSADSIEDIKLGRKHEEIVSENCQRCHRDTARAGDRKSRAMAHGRHQKLGIGCVACHSGNVAHPVEGQAEHPVAGLVEVATCFQCHDGGHRYGEAVAFATTNENHCAKCHPDATFAQAHFEGDKSGKRHKPCLDCHQQTKGQPHYAMAKADTPMMCARCHEPAKDLVSTHKPYQQGDCAACHQVMVPAFLFKHSAKGDKAFCLGCHDGMAMALAAPATATACLDCGPNAIRMPMQASLTIGDDGDLDLHRDHLDNIGDSPQVCRSCHAGHGGPSARGLIVLRGDDDVRGTHTATPDGGNCTGACHDDDTVQYQRRPIALPAVATPVQ